MVMEKGNNLQFVILFCFNCVWLIQWHLAAAFLFCFAMFVSTRIMSAFWNIENIRMLCSYPQSVFMCLQLHVCVAGSWILDTKYVRNSKVFT